MKRALRILAALLALAALAGLAANLWLIAGSTPEVGAAADCPARDVAIVLGSRIRADGRPSAPLEDRLQAALALWNAGRVRQILVSGDHELRDEDGSMARWLAERGVPPEAILRDGSGIRTRVSLENAARRFGVKSAVICSQRYHLPRALAWARHLGIDAVGLVVGSSRPVEIRTYIREILARVLAAYELL